MLEVKKKEGGKKSRWITPVTPEKKKVTRVAATATPTFNPKRERAKGTPSRLIDWLIKIPTATPPQDEDKVTSTTTVVKENARATPTFTGENSKVRVSRSATLPLTPKKDNGQDSPEKAKVTVRVTPPVTPRKDKSKVTITATHPYHVPEYEMGSVGIQQLLDYTDDMFGDFDKQEQENSPLGSPAFTSTPFIRPDSPPGSPTTASPDIFCKYRSPAFTPLIRPDSLWGSPEFTSTPLIHSDSPPGSPTVTSPSIFSAYRPMGRSELMSTRLIRADSPPGSLAFTSTPLIHPGSSTVTSPSIFRSYRTLKSPEFTSTPLIRPDSRPESPTVTSPSLIRTNSPPKAAIFAPPSLIRPDSRPESPTVTSPSLIHTYSPPKAAIFAPPSLTRPDSRPESPSVTSPSLIRTYSPPKAAIFAPPSLIRTDSRPKTPEFTSASPLCTYSRPEPKRMAFKPSFIKKLDPIFKAPQNIKTPFSRPSYEMPARVLQQQLNSTDDMLRDFDKLPTKEIEDTFKPVRKKAERAKLSGIVCDMCRDYYGCMEAEMHPREIQDIIDRCSRHRTARPINLNETPEGFWDNDFPSTAVAYEQGYIAVGIASPLAPRRRYDLMESDL